MQQEFCDIAQNQRGVLRVGVTYTHGRTIMPGIIQTFQKSYPAIRVDLVEDTNDVLKQKLVNGEMDLAIANFPDSLPDIELKEFYNEEVVMLVSRDLFASLYGDAETLFALCTRGVGACFCPEILAHASLNDEQLSQLLILRLGEKARCLISFGYQKRSYQWSIIESFMTIAKEVIS